MCIRDRYNMYHHQPKTYHAPVTTPYHAPVTTPSHYAYHEPVYHHPADMMMEHKPEMKDEMMGKTDCAVPYFTKVIRSKNVT